MPEVETLKPKPNMNDEYVCDITPNKNNTIGIYDVSRWLVPYNGGERDRLLSRVTHEIHGRKATVYIIDSYNLVNRKQAIKLAERFINGDFDTYRLD